MRIIAVLLLLSTMVVNANQLLNHKHKDIFQNTNDELLIYGGANAGKSYSVADKVVLFPAVNRRLGIKDKLKALVLRKTLPSLKTTCMELIENEAKKFNIPYNLNKQDYTAQIENMQILYRSVNNKDDIDRVMSLTDVDLIWIEELPEIRETDYRKLLTRLRGGKARYPQIISTFNPIGKTSWVYNRFFQRNIGNVAKFKYTIRDNPWASKREINILKNSKEDDVNFYNIYYLGEWGELEGVIYNWDTVPFPKDIVFDEIFYGGDFGFSIDPAAVVRIYRKADHFWLQELVYERNLTNPSLASDLLSKGVTSYDDTYWDSQEPKSIQELVDNSINAKPALKGPDSVRAGIKFLQSQKIHILEGSENLAKEQKAYIWKKDKDGNSTGKPIEFNDHLMDSARYGIFTHMKSAGDFFIGESKNAVY